MKVFSIYARSIFLYNRKLWALTAKLSEQMDCIQRKFVRRILKVHWPEMISIEKLYEKTKHEPWCAIVKGRALNWMGHLLLLDETTPSRRALDAYLKSCKRPPECPKETWLDYVSHLSNNNANISWVSIPTMIKDLEQICTDRQMWREVVRHMNL